MEIVNPMAQSTAPIDKMNSGVGPVPPPVTGGIPGPGPPVVGLQGDLTQHVDLGYAALQPARVGNRSHSLSVLPPSIVVTHMPAQVAGVPPSGKSHPGSVLAHVLHIPPCPMHVGAITAIRKMTNFILIPKLDTT